MENVQSSFQTQLLDNWGFEIFFLLEIFILYFAPHPVVLWTDSWLCGVGGVPYPVVFSALLLALHSGIAPSSAQAVGGRTRVSHVQEQHSPRCVGQQAQGQAFPLIN